MTRTELESISFFAATESDLFAEAMTLSYKSAGRVCPPLDVTTGMVRRLSPWRV